MLSCLTCVHGLDEHFEAGLIEVGKDEALGLRGLEQLPNLEALAGQDGFVDTDARPTSGHQSEVGELLPGCPVAVGERHQPASVGPTAHREPVTSLSLLERKYLQIFRR